MFTVIEFSDNKKGRFKKLFCRIVHEMPELTKVAVNGGAPYFKIKVSDNKKIPWEDILYMAGRCASNVILKDEVQIPKDLKIHRFVPKEFPLITLSNTVKNILSDCNIKKKKLGISDADAVLVNRIEGFIDFVSEITIYTKETDKYLGVCERLMDEYGISIVLSDFENSLCLCDVVMSENAFEDIFCFCINKGTSENAFELSDVALPTFCKQKLPDGISDEYFAAALFELCKVSSLGDLEFQTLKFNNEIITYTELKELFQNLIKN